MAEHEGHIEIERTVDSIIVGHRYRTNAKHELESLMASIKKIGLVQPVTITPDGVLVCGARRLEAVKQLGWRTIKVWVRSGISDDLNSLLAQQDENAERQPLSQLEQAALFRELHKLIREEAKRRQEATQFGEDRQPDGADGPGSGPGPHPGHGDSRHQAALAVTGKASYHHLERISAIERIAADRTLPDTVRKIAEIELSEIEKGGDVRPAYERVLVAKEQISAAEAADPRPLSPEEVAELAQEAREQLRQDGARGGAGSMRAKPGPTYRSLRAFLLTWGDLDGWSRFFNPTEIAAQLKQDDLEMFERVIAETITFADEVRALRNASQVA